MPVRGAEPFEAFLLRGVDAFLPGALNYVPLGSIEAGTDLVVAPLSLSGGE